jgi:hypothetical protein
LERRERTFATRDGEHILAQGERKGERRSQREKKKRGTDADRRKKEKKNNSRSQHEI